MKEAFWGVLIIVLGLFGIVVVNIFQNVTVDNDRVYYLIKESTEAAAYEAVDLTYYRLSGKLRISEDKFVENLTRRFAENVTMGDYTIIVEDINELPPKISLRVRSGVTSTIGKLGSNKLEEFGIVNRVDGIIETKYSLEEVLDFLGITEDEWKDGETKYDVDSNGKNVCEVSIKEELECITGDIMFVGFDEVTLNHGLCEAPQEYIDRKAKYKVCNCGKWEETSELVTAKRTPVGREYEYTWNFTKKGELRTISESIKESVLKPVCTTGIEEMVPKDIEEVTPLENEKSYEPSSDNSKYMLCPEEGIKIPIGMKFTMHPNYIPKESINRYLTWTSTDENVLGITYNKVTDEKNIEKHPINDCPLNSSATNCLFKATVTAKNVGTSYVNVKTTQGQTATCKVEVFDGKVDSVGCEDMSVDVNKKGVVKVKYEPKNSTIYDFTYSIANEKIATIEGNTVTAKAGGSTTITVTETNTGKTGTCTLKVPSPPEPPKSYSAEEVASGEGYWKTVDPTGKVEWHNTYEDALKSAKETAGAGEPTTISYGNSDGEIKYSEVTNDRTSSSVYTTNEVYYNGNLESQGSKTEEKRGKTTYIITTDKDGIISSETKYDKSQQSSNSSNDSGSECYYCWITDYPPTWGGIHGCFEEKTKVLTENGYKDIDKIQIGDKVLSYNEDTEQNEYKEVTQLYVHSSSKDTLYSLNINNKILKVTSMHRFYVKTNDSYEWIHAKDLKIGDLVMDSKGNYYPIRRITSKEIVNDLYNIEVEDNHNYYVSRDNILVHNIK